MDKLLIIAAITVAFCLPCRAQIIVEQTSGDLFYETEISLGYSTFERWKTSIACIPSLKLNPHLSVGIGAKYTRVHERWQEIEMIAHNQVDIEIRGYGYLKKQINTPYLQATGGYNIRLNEERFNKPLYAGIGIGKRIGIKNSSLLFTANYSFYQSRFSYRLSRSIELSDWYRNHSINGSVAYRF